MDIRSFKDIFAFMKDKKVAIDVNSPWFQELWYPISKKIGILLTTYLLEWMGYAGEYKIQKQNFVKLLDNNKIPYEEISHTDPRVDLNRRVDLNINSNLIFYL